MNIPRPHVDGRAFRGHRTSAKKALAGVSSLLLAVTLLPIGLLTPAQSAQINVGQGFSITPSDLKFILAQIKIAENHVANTTTATGPCGALVGTGPNQIPSPLVSKGLRTVDGSCNNLQDGQETFGAADQVFPRIGGKDFRPAEVNPPLFGPPNPSSYADKTPNNVVFDSQPRVISNLIVDQTSSNPAAIAAAGEPVRSQGGDPVVPCQTPAVLDPITGLPVPCVEAHKTLFIPNVTTDVGLSPPYNSLFTIFGQFFDHGVDQTVKGGGTVIVPLNDDDPLVAGDDHDFGTGCNDPATATAACADNLPANLRFMPLTRGKNQAGEDGILGTTDDVQDAVNTDSPWVDQSQTYTSHSSHQAFLREYNLVGGVPVATGKLLGGRLDATGAPVLAAVGEDQGISTWAAVKAQARLRLGLLLTDADVENIPMLVTDPYGNFIPGPVRGLPQYMTATGPVEGNRTTPVAPPANVLHFETPFLTDIAHSAVPKRTAGGALFPDTDLVAGESLDTTVPAGSYDDELLDSHFSCGDGRCNENIALSAVHQIFHSEHDRLVDDITTTLNDPANLTLLQAYQATGANTFDFGERLFQAARFVTEMEYQHLVFEEFARKVQPAINPFEPFAFTETQINPAVKAEFAHAVYRFGHSMLTDTIARRNEDQPGGDGQLGTSDDILGSPNDVSLLDGFLNPPKYTQATPGGPSGALNARQAAGSIMMGLSDDTGNELDEFVTETLRNNLLGLPLDLPTINMTRARSEGIPPLNVFRRQVFNATNDGQMTPYVNWIDFGEHLKHPESLVNFVAAYGKHPTITGATTVVAKRNAARAIVAPDLTLGDVTPPDAAAFMNSVAFAGGTDWSTTPTGLDSIDLWVGGLAEVTNVFGGLLGSTFNYVFENQLTDLQNGDRLYYLARTPGMNLRTQLEGNSFAELIMRNTNAHSLKADAFATADCKFELKNLNGTAAGFNTFGNTVANDPQSECNETLLLLRQPDGTIKYRSRNTVDPSGINGQSVYNGTAGVDRIFGGNDSDTFWGGDAQDWIEGGDGADIALGGEGPDIITDLNGDDVPKGGPGNDAIDAGPGLDIVMGGTGKDFTNGGANANETFGGDGDDFIMLGESLDAAFGDSGDDYEEGGGQPDLMQGDSGNLFFVDDSQRPGSDILVGQGGDDDYDMEGGDDIGVGGPGVEKVSGASGYDWEIGIGDPQAQDMDLAIPLIPLDILQVGVRDKFNEVESLSGGDLNDTLRGDDLVPSTVGGGGFIGCDVLDQRGLDRINGLDALVPPLATPLQDVIDVSTSRDCPVLTDGLTPAQVAAARVWGDGNILLGGGGSDLIEGRGADDIIDGDKYMNLRLSVRTAAGAEIGSATVNKVGQSPMTSQLVAPTGQTLPANLVGKTLQQAVFAGLVDPGNIVAVREISTGSGGTDTAVFSDVRANYTVTFRADGAVIVNHTGGTAVDGIDTLTNIERLRFSDQTISVVTPGAPTIGNATAGNASALVRWTAPAGSAGGITSFNIQVVNAGTGAPVGALRTAGPAASQLNVTGLVNGTSYQFRVQAVNTNAPVPAGPFSALSNVVTPAVVATAPTVAPAIGLALPGLAAGGVINATATWGGVAAAGNGGSTITGYEVTATRVGVGTTTVQVVGPAVRLLTMTLPVANVQYTFTVKAINAIGSGPASAASNAVIAR